jgi:hypothetical protein
LIGKNAIGRSRGTGRRKKIGTAGFEPATPATPLQCATGLRYVPNREGVSVALA